MKVEYKKTEHLVYSYKAHIVFCPKYRRRILTGDIKKRCEEIFYEVAAQYKFDIIEMELMSDHVHLLLECNPRFGMMNCVKKLKAISYRKLRTEFPEINRRLPTLWTRNAFVSTIGEVSLDIVKQYINAQETN